MDISIGTNMLECGPPWRLARRHLARLAEAGVRAVDLHMGARYEAASGPTPLTPTRAFVDFRDPGHRAEISGWLSELGLRAVCAHSPVMGVVDLSSLDEAVRAFAVGELRATVELCASLGIPVVVAHAGERAGAGESRQQRWEQVARSVGEVAPDLARCGVRLALENILPDSLTPHVAQLASDVQALGCSHVGVCLDTGHLNIVGGRPAAAVREVGERLLALHVHDNSGDSDEHRPPGDGSIEWAGFAAALAEVGYEGTLNLEVVQRDTEDGMASAAFIRRAMAGGREVLKG